MVNIYTDASVANDHAVTTCFILTDFNFLGHSVFNHDGIATSVLGEILGAIYGIHYAESVVDMNDTIVLHSDSSTLSYLLQYNLDDSNYKQVQLYREELKELRDLLNKYNIELTLIKGHQSEHNPNKVVDLISNSILRYEDKKV